MAHYIDKSDLLAEIEKIMNEQQEICKADVALGKNPDSKNIEVIYQFQQFIKFLDTLEVKEVDLDSDIRTYLTNNFNIYEDGVLQSKKSGLPLSTYDIIKGAKHFFELGLQAKKGE